MCPRTLPVLVLVLVPVAVTALLLGAARLRPVPPAPRSIEHEAFRLLPWSRLAREPDAEGRLRVRLGPRAPGLAVRLLGTSCGCARAALADGVLCVVVSPQRPPRQVRVRVGVARGAARAVRTLCLEPRSRLRRRAPMLVRHAVPPGAPDAVGLLHARLHLAGRAPPRLRTDAPLHAVVHPDPAGGHDVLLSGRASSRALRAPGALVTAEAVVPLRIFRTARGER